MDELLDSLPSELDIHQALRAWHHLARLTQTRFARSRLVSQHSNLRHAAQSTPQLLAHAIRETLLDAIRQLQPAQSGEHGHNLIHSKYVLNQSVNQICMNGHLSPRTFHRYLARELSELTAIVARMTMALPANARSQNTAAPNTPIVSSAIPNNLLFVGRHAPFEQARQALLSSEAGAVVGITGLPGAGKSTLASALANDATIGQHYPDGIVWVPVGHANLPSCMTQWLTDMGLDNDELVKMPAEQQRRAIRTALVGKRVLIVLDDVWQLTDARSLMLGGRGASYVITTCQPGLAHELATCVIGLGDFDVGETLTLLEHYLPHEMRLAARFNLDLQHVADLVRGLPLTVSLAARNLARLVRLGQMNRLQAYLANGLLQDGHDALADRLREAMHVLSPRERRVLIVLSLFPPKPNTFSEAFACAVGDCNVANLDALVDAGLLECQHGRYSLHMAIASLLVMQMTESTARLRMVEFVARALEDATPMLSSQDLQNVLAALAQADWLNRPDLFADIASASVWLFENSSNVALLLPALRQACDTATSQLQRERLNIHLAHAQWLAESNEVAFTELTQAIQRANLSRNPELATLVARLMADITFERDNMQSAIGYAQSAAMAWNSYHARHKERLEVASLRRYMLHSQFDKLRQLLVRVIPDAIAKAVPLPQILTATTAKGWLDVLQGDVSAGLPQLNESFERATRLGHRLPDIFAAGALAWTYYHLGDYAKARLMGHHVLHAPYRDVFADFVVQAHSILASVALAQGDEAEAWRYLIEGLNYCDQRSIDAMASSLHATMAHWHLRYGSLREAQKCAEGARQVARSFHFDAMISASLTLMAVVEAKSGHLTAARRQLNEAGESARHQHVNPWTAAYCALYRGEVLLECGEIGLADEALTQSITLAQQLGAHEFHGRSLFAQARLKCLEGDYETARQIAIQSGAMLRNIGHVAADEVNDWLAQSTINGAEAQRPR